MRPFPALFAALVGSQLCYPRLPPGRREAATRGIVVLMLAASMAETAAARGRAKALVLGATAATVGFGAELAGVATGRPFGHYTYGAGLGRRVGGVPLLAAAAWTMMARPAWVVAGLVTRRRIPRVGLAAGALTAWDVFLDPRMVRDGYWTWPGGGRYEGVPATNFLGWLATGGAVFAVWSAIDGDDDPAADGDGALALYVWTWVGEGVANLLFWDRPRVAAAGGAAMGAVAAPALWSRLRRAPRTKGPVAAPGLSAHLRRAPRTKGPFAAPALSAHLRRAPRPTGGARPPRTAGTARERRRWR